MAKQQEKIFAGTWSFNKRVSPLQLKEWFCPVDLNLEKMKLMMQTHNVTALYTLNLTK